MLLLLALLAVADAYETDQLTDREVPLGDVVAPANEHANALIDVAVAQTNRRVRPTAPDERMRKVLAKRLHHVLTHSERVKGRGFFMGMGYSAYSAWMETADLPRREFVDRHDIYGDVPMRASTILHLVGPSSTFELAGVLMGSDKPDHFFDLGFYYLRWSRWGQEPERAVHGGTFTERSYYGLLTSKTFSFADLEANYQGFLFYDGLLAPYSVIQRDDSGRARRVRSFDWSEWVNPGWDEVINPSVHTRRVQEAVSAHLLEHRDAYCATWESMGSVDWQVEQPPPYVADEAPEQTDPYDLAGMCAAEGTGDGPAAAH